MDEFEKLDVSVSHDTAAIVRDAVASGEFASSSDVVSDALHAWHASRAEDEREISRLRKLVAEGEASGIVPWEGADALLAKIHARAAGG